MWSIYFQHQTLAVVLCTIIAAGCTYTPLNANDLTTCSGTVVGELCSGDSNGDVGPGDDGKGDNVNRGNGEDGPGDTTTTSCPSQQFLNDEGNCVLTCEGDSWISCNNVGTTSCVAGPELTEAQCTCLAGYHLATARGRNFCAANCGEGTQDNNNNGTCNDSCDTLACENGCDDSTGIAVCGCAPNQRLAAPLVDPTTCVSITCVNCSNSQVCVDHNDKRGATCRTVVRVSVNGRDNALGDTWKTTKSMQAAVAEVSDKTDIWVRAETISLNTGALELNTGVKDVAIYGGFPSQPKADNDFNERLSGPPTTIVQKPGAMGGAAFFAVTGGSNIIIDGFIFRGATTAALRLIDVVGATIQKTAYIGNDLGIEAGGCTDLNIRYSYFGNNGVDGGDEGAALRLFNSRVTIDRIVSENNRANLGPGLYVSASPIADSAVSVSNSLIRGNNGNGGIEELGTAIYATGPGNNTVLTLSDSVIIDNGNLGESSAPLVYLGQGTGLLAARVLIADNMQRASVEPVLEASGGNSYMHLYRVTLSGDTGHPALGFGTYTTLLGTSAYGSLLLAGAALTTPKDSVFDKVNSVLAENGQQWFAAVPNQLQPRWSATVVGRERGVTRLKVKGLPPELTFKRPLSYLVKVVTEESSSITEIFPFLGFNPDKQTLLLIGSVGSRDGYNENLELEGKLTFLNYMPHEESTAIDAGYAFEKNTLDILGYDLVDIPAVSDSGANDVNQETSPVDIGCYELGGSVPSGL